MAFSRLQWLRSWRAAVKLAPQIGLCQRAASNSRKLKPSKPLDFPGSEWENFMPHGESKEILFEDVFEAGNGEETFNWGQDEPEPSTAEPAVESKPPPLEDHDLPDANLLTLAKDEFVWAVGRAATLKLSSDSRVWKDLPHAVHAFGGLSEFTPSEVCRLVQALAYAPADAPVDKKLLQRLFKIFALRAKEFSDERLMRMVYAYGKLSSKRGLCLPRFMDFATSEVVEREAGLPSWRKVRILESVGSLPEAGREFKTLLVAQIMKVGTQKLDADSFAKFVPMIVDTKYHERPGAVERINAVYRRKLKNIRFSNPDLILASGMPLFLFDLMKTSVLTRWLDRLSRLHLPLVAGATVQSGLIFVLGSNQQDWLKPAGAGRASKNLEALKLVDFVLRHERASSLEVLTPQGLQLLAKARDTALQPPDDHDMPELPHVYAGLSKLFRKLGILLHPTTCGPYLLELADPLGQLVVEWDTSWKLYPPWRQDRHREFVQRKHFHLRAEGWKVIVMPLDTFSALPAEEKLGFLDSFCNEQKLNYLRVGAPEGSQVAAQ